MYRARSENTKNYCDYLYSISQKKELIIFDVETTGTKKEKDRIVQFAGKKYMIENHQWTKKEEINLYIKPPFYMTQRVIDIHHITNEFLEDKPSEEEVIDQIVSFMEGVDIVVGQNVPFDIGMLSSLYERQKQKFPTFHVLDTLDMLYDFFEREELNGSYSLESATKACGLDAGITFHNGKDDVLATERLFFYLLEKYKKMEKQKPKEKFLINKIYFSKGYRKEQIGIYVKTQVGTVYFSTYNKAWYSKLVCLDDYDVTDLENRICRGLQLNRYEFERLTETKYKKALQSRK